MSPTAAMHACDYLLACDMEMDPVPGYRFTSWETGYGDFHPRPGPSTLRRAAWLPRTALVLCDLMTQREAPVEVAPRRMLQRQLERAREAGFTVMGGIRDRALCLRRQLRRRRQKRYHDLRPPAAYYEDYHILQGTKEEHLIGAIRRGLDRQRRARRVHQGRVGTAASRRSISATARR